jgi:hypothetical protein
VSGHAATSHEPRPGLPQQQQQEEKPFFQRLLPHAIRAGIQADRRHDDDRLIGVRHLPDRRPERFKLALKRLESRRQFLVGQADRFR